MTEELIQKHAACSFPVVEELPVATATDVNSPTNNEPVARETAACHSICLLDPLSLLSKIAELLPVLVLWTSPNDTGTWCCSGLFFIPSGLLHQKSLQQCFYFPSSVVPVNAWPCHDPTRRDCTCTSVWARVHARECFVLSKKPQAKDVQVKEEYWDDKWWQPWDLVVHLSC